MPAPPRSFSVGFLRADAPDETAAAATVARRIGGEHVVLSLDPAALADLDPIQAALEEPLADSALVPLWHLCRGTARQMKVALSGEGGDEALGGYTRYFWGQAASALSSGVASSAVQLLGGALPRLPARSRGLGNLARRAGKFADTVALPEAQRYLGWFELLGAEERRALTGQDGSGVTARVEELFGEARALGLDVVQRMQYVDISLALLDNLLVKADKLSMAHGLEVRVPLVDRKLVELGLALPARAKIGVRGNKPLLRRFLSERLPRSITRGGKRGFEIPVDRWFRQPATAHLRDRLVGGAMVRTLGFSATAIRRLVDRHLGGEDLGRKLFALAVLETWAERYC
jgi:asparagine synthase (glutamine-hydrolysing)